MKITDNDVVVDSWSELCERLYDNSWKEPLGRFRTDYAFRGVSDKSFDLKNGFIRQCGHNPGLEYHLLRNFRKYAQVKDQNLLGSEWRVLTLGQHYGLPTRLLDWTYSPFVAIHFATEDLSQYDKDGVVWKVDFVQANRRLPSLLKDVLEQVGSHAFTIEMIEEALPKLSSFDTMSDTNQVIFFEPPSLDSRIINQYALFSVMSSATALMNEWLCNNPELFRRIIIPKALKWEVRDKLDQANISERLLFPGLDGLARWLRRHYSPKF